MKKKNQTNQKSSKNKYVLVPLAVLLSLSSFLVGTKYEKQIKDTIENEPVIVNNQVLEFPKEAKVKRVIDGDTIELNNSQIVRLVGVNAPNNNEKYEEQATEYTKNLIEGRKVNLEYDSYKSDRFGRILAYVIINDKNLAIELVKRGLAKVTIYEKRKPFIYQQELLSAQNQAKRNKINLLEDDD
ncbi:hypothetical protein A3D78_05830 [Candidatus Gottesmanbacteria bacterium RIFCSPHIGHO2_02_FULL_39_14]|uniref:TNase-like domain-containing protein n=1 Tax=Candidatus Gottesmanbacteria bacterium RIFCSPHIGHO2_02_FULL_39_14 TaxID=1798383 RepID=A0A1F6A3T4_9BACT|nr:MAG: hypothetical protein A3D78_05830 [Candidatus Gottesmanbacteria bacterium RIFCSPHIGHO2_02_FULL_39_14]